MKRVYRTRMTVLQWILSAALAIVLCCGILVVDASADTSAVTITYSDGTTEGWDGTSDKTISQPAAITVNKSYTQTGKLTISADSSISVSFNGAGNTITAALGSSTDNKFAISGNANVVFNNVTITASNSGIPGYEITPNALMVVDGSAQLTLTGSNVSATGCRILWVGGASKVTMDGNSQLSSNYYDIISTVASSTPTVTLGDATLTLSALSATNYQAYAINNRGQGTVNISGGSISAEFSPLSCDSYNGASAIKNANGGKVNISGGTIKAWGCIVAQASTSTTNPQDNVLNISGGTLQNTANATYRWQREQTLIQCGTVTMTGGSLVGNGNTQYAIRVSNRGNTVLTLTGGTISGSDYSVNAEENATHPYIKVGGSFNDQTTNGIFLMRNESAITLLSDLTTSLRIWIYSGYSSGRIIAYADSPSVLSKLSLHVSGYTYPWSVGYNSTDQSIYMYYHQHNWTYTVDDNKITVVCVGTSSAKYCPYTATQQAVLGELTWTLHAEDASCKADGGLYTGASVTAPARELSESPWGTGVLTYVGRADTTYTESETAPAGPGRYTVKYTITASNNKKYSATKDITISEASTDVVTITYSDGSVAYWDGKSDLTISKGATLTVNGNYTQTKRLTINTSEPVTFDGNGHTITTMPEDETDDKFYITGNSNVTFKNTAITVNGYQASSNDSPNALMVVDGGAQLTLSDNNSVTASNSRIIWAAGNSQVVIDGGSTLSSDREVIITAPDTAPTVTIKDATIELTYDEATSYRYASYAIYNNGQGTINVTGGEIRAENSKGNSRGSAIRNCSSGVVNISGGTIKTHGDAIRQDTKDSRLNVSGGTIKNTGNYAGDNLFIGGKIQITGGEMIGNGSEYYAIISSSYLDLTITGGTFSGFYYSVYIDGDYGDKIRIGGDFEDNTQIGILLGTSDATFTLDGVPSNDIHMWVYGGVADGRHLTTNGAASGAEGKFSLPYNSSYRVGYNETDQYYYMYIPSPDPDPQPTPDPDPQPTPTPTPGGDTTMTKNAVPQPKPCNHVYEWDTYKTATGTADGEMRYRCKYCGDVRYTVPVTAYYTFNKETQEKVLQAAQGATVKVQTPWFISFHEMVYKALQERPDVTLIVDYKNANALYEMTIPAGSGDQLQSLFGESRFAGFLYLGGIYGTIELPRDTVFDGVTATEMWFGTTTAH